MYPIQCETLIDKQGLVIDETKKTITIQDMADLSNLANQYQIHNIRQRCRN